jgi:hypothetical protein
VRSGQHEVVREAALGRARPPKLLGVREHRGVLARAPPGHDALVERAQRGIADVGRVGADGTVLTRKPLLLTSDQRTQWLYDTSITVWSRHQDQGGDSAG